MKKELKSGILSADKSADCRPTVGGANVIAVLGYRMCCGSYGGRLRAIKLFLWLHGSAEYIKMGLWWLERLKTQ